MYLWIYVSMYQCMYVCMCVCTYAGMRVCVCMYVCMHACMYVRRIYACQCMAMYVNVCQCTSLYVNVCHRMSMHVNECQCMSMYVNVNMDVCMHSCMYVLIKIPLCGNGDSSRIKHVVPRRLLWNQFFLLQNPHVGQQCLLWRFIHHLPSYAKLSPITSW